MNHLTFKSIIRLSKRGIIPRNIREFRPPPSCVAWLFGKYHTRPCRTKGKQPGGYIRKAFETIPMAMTAIEHMIYYQPGINNKVAGLLTHKRFWEATVFVDHYSDYWYNHTMRRTSYEETLQTKEAYESLAVTHGTGVCAHREKRNIPEDPVQRGSPEMWTTDKLLRGGI